VEKVGFLTKNASQTNVCIYYRSGRKINKPDTYLAP